jgi:cytochrome b involved in lipid metabolism
MNNSDNTTDKRIYVMLYGKWYGIDETWNHPGGPIAIQNIENREATALFELHHPFVHKSILRKYLHKFQVTSPPSSNSNAQAIVNNPMQDFIWNDIMNPELDKADAFRYDLIQVTKNYFLSESKRRGT